VAWLSHQKCDDMFISSRWNGTSTYGFGDNTRDFGTDYGICCWYTPQLNFSAIPDGPDTDWAFWFNSVPKGRERTREAILTTFLARKWRIKGNPPRPNCGEDRSPLFSHFWLAFAGYPSAKSALDLPPPLAHRKHSS